MHLVPNLNPPATPPDVFVRNSADGERFSIEEFDSACSTPFVSAPSSPTRGGVGGGGGGSPSGYFFSAPASPVHYVLSSAYRESAEGATVDGFAVSDFEFSSRYGASGSNGSGSMSSADELFLNGKIRPMKLSLSSHLQRPQTFNPLVDLEEDDETAEVEIEETFMMVRGKDMRMRNRSIHRKTRSLSPLRNEWREKCLDLEQVQVLNEGLLDLAAEKQSEELEQTSCEATAFGSASSSRSSSTGSRNSKKWIYLKDLLYRSKSEGRASTTKDKFWSSFFPAKEKKSSEEKTTQKGKKLQPQQQQKNLASVKNGVGKPANGNVSKRRVPPSAHERHYTANRAQAEEMKKKTYLPYRQGLIGCLGFSSKGYGALHGFTKTLNPVSS